MTDLAARQAQRLAAQGDPEAERALLVAMIRADDHRLDTPTRCRYCDTGRERLLVQCSACKGIGDWCDVHEERVGAACAFSDCGPGQCPTCAGSGLVTLPWEGPAGRLDALAYCGNEIAWELCGWRGWWSPEDDMHYPGPPRIGFPLIMQDGSLGWTLRFTDWLTGLTRWPADLAAVAALGAAWAALEAWWVRASWEPHGPRGTLEAPRAALSACADYLACGCEGSWEAWCRSLDPLRPRSPDMLWLPWTEPFYPEADGTEIRHAARLLGSEDTRAAACGALTAWLLGRGVHGVVCTHEPKDPETWCANGVPRG